MRIELVIGALLLAAFSLTVRAQTAIMPLGDSITAGVGDDAPADNNQAMGYRTSLYNDLSFNFQFVGSQTNGPADLPFPHHEGHGGYRIDQLRSSIDSWLAQNPADVVLLQIGTNDIWQGMDDGADSRLQDLITRIGDVSPGTLVVVAQITPMSNIAGINDRVNAYNQKVLAVVASLRAAGRAVYPIDMNSAIDPTAGGSDLSADGVHPRQVGYAKIGLRWSAILNRLYRQGLLNNSGVRPAFTPAYVTPYSLNVTGQIDAVNTSGMYGWACVSGLSLSIPVDIYIGAPYPIGQMLERAKATAQSEDAVHEICQNKGNHYRFAVPWQAGQSDNFSGQPIYIYGISPSGLGTALLNNSGNFTVP